MFNKLHIDSEFAFETTKGIPAAVSEVVLREWEAIKNRPQPRKVGAARVNPARGVYGVLLPDDRPRTANIWLRQTAEIIRSVGMPRRLLLDENDITATSKALASRSNWLRRNGASLADVEALARLYAIDLPDWSTGGRTEASVWSRASDVAFWKRQIRTAHSRLAERGARLAGRVHNRAGLYASDDAVRRKAARKRRNNELLTSLLVVNELGQEYSLAELAALSTSNPLIRRAELMVRLRGFEEYAKEQAHACDFFTVTCPGSYHAWSSKTGKPNPSYQPAIGPREAQAHLQRVWSRARAKLHRAGIRVYGFRVAEPHHDGTPHWHMVLFFKQEDRREIRRIIRHYSLQVDPFERGAWRRRCTFKRIDLERGSACGYVAKYIAKNIDGRRADSSDLPDFDYESNPANPAIFNETAFRVEAWAGWGIRQFQQIGSVPVTVWRELRRLDADEQRPELADLIAAADQSDWARYVSLQGGAMVKRAGLRARSYREPHTNRYGEETARIKGVECFTGIDAETSQPMSVVAISRIHEWTISYASAGCGPRTEEEGHSGVSRPWTRVNNCTHTLSSRSAFRESLMDEYDSPSITFPPSPSFNDSPPWIH